MLRPCLICLLLFPLATTAAAAQGLPQRIVSMNLCTDQLLLLLVARERIAALSHFASNPDYSSLAAEAQGIPLNHGQAEEVLNFHPDLVLTSLFSATLTSSLLERLGQRVERLGFANTLNEVHEQIRQVAALTGSETVAETLIAGFSSTIATATAQLRERVAGQKAVFYSVNGVSYGAGTLQHDFLDSLGLRNVAAEAGLQGPAPLPLELLLTAEPAFIFTDRRGQLDRQLAQPLLDHPALQAVARRARVIELSERWFQCAGPQVALAWQALAAQLDEEQIQGAVDAR